MLAHLVVSSMNMQMSPASTHTLRDPLVDDHTLIWLVTPSVWRQKHQRFQTVFCCRLMNLHKVRL